MVAIETGGRWSDEAADFLWQLAWAKAREAPALVFHSTALGLGNAGGTRMSGTACAVSFAESLVEPSESLTWCHTGGEKGREGKEEYEEEDEEDEERERD